MQLLVKRYVKRSERSSVRNHPIPPKSDKTSSTSSLDISPAIAADSLLENVGAVLKNREPAFCGIPFLSNVLIFRYMSMIFHMSREVVPFLTPAWPHGFRIMRVHLIKPP